MLELASAYFILFFYYYPRRLALALALAQAYLLPLVWCCGVENRRRFSREIEQQSFLVEKNNVIKRKNNKYNKDLK